MPMFEFAACSCGRKEIERYFPSFAASEVPQRCPKCGATMHKVPSLPVMKTFQPYITRNIRADGKPVTVTSKGQLQRLMRENHVVPSPLSDTVEGRADPREFHQLMKEERRDFPKKYRKLKENVKTLSAGEAAKLQERAIATQQETRRA